MFAIFLKHKLLTCMIFILLLLSIICQIIMGVIFQNMIHAADNMSTTENKLLKQCKLKYTNYYKLNGKLVNTSVFVDKFIQNIRIAKFSLCRLSHVAGQLMMLSVVVTGITICLSLTAGDTLFQIIPYYLSSILGLYLYFSVSGIVDIQGKQKILKTNVVDYLENHLAPRLEVEKENALTEGEKSREVIVEEIRKEVQSSDNHKEKEMENSRAVTASVDTSEELELLLEEFFA